MSEENEECIRQFFGEVLNRDNLAALDLLLAPDSVDHGPSMIGAAPGEGGLRHALALYRAALPDLHYSLDEILTVGDRVIARWTARGTFTGHLPGTAATGRRVAVTGTTLYRVAAGKIQESWGNWDALGLLLQLGSIPAAALPWGRDIVI